MLFNVVWDGVVLFDVVWDRGSVAGCGLGYGPHPGGEGKGLDDYTMLSLEVKIKGLSRNSVGGSTVYYCTDSCLM